MFNTWNDVLKLHSAHVGQVTVAGVTAHNLARATRQHLVRAGLKRWPKFFQAMRSSCENDWKQAGIAEPTYCAWVGHSAKVSREHYVSPTEAEYALVTRA